MKKCVVEDCHKPAKTAIRGFCGMHDMRQRRYGSLEVPPRVKSVRHCDETGCQNKHVAHGYCSLHLQRLNRNGSVVASHKYEHHGMDGTPELATWKRIVQRTTNANCKDYPYYGGRGIKMCNKWRKSFLAFYADMGPRPTGGTIERIDNSGDYAPGNCKWATRLEQSNNRRMQPGASGVVGVYWCRTNHRWKASIGWLGKRRDLGSFRSKSDAIAARKNAELKKANLI